MIIKTLASGASGMRAHQIKLDTIGNNIANINTTGYKKSRAEFADMVKQAIGEEGIPVEEQQPRPASGAGVRLISVARLDEQGDLLQTGRELDLAIDGQGFFKVTSIDGDQEYYTRDGSFFINDEGLIVNGSGYQLQDGITIDKTEYQSFSINEKGQILGVPNGDPTTEPEEIGQIELSTFPAPANLEAVGNNMFIYNQAAGEENPLTPGEEGAGYIRSGFLERSTVDLATEMIGMIEAQRAYAANSRTIQTADEMWDRANNLRK